MTSVALVVASGATFKDYWQLTKPGVMLLVVFTAAVGLFCAPAHLPFLQSLVIILAIALGSAAGATFNMWYDADIDCVMQRTRKRPIPAGKIHENDALMLSLTMAIIAVSILGLASNWAAAGMLAFAIWFYACFYTMILKRATAQNIVIGGAAGAFPPIIGWLAASPSISFEPICYFLIVFLWTPPHFWALALYRHDDYRSANVPMLPVIAGEKSTLRHITVYSFLLVAVSILPYFLNYLGAIYLFAACGLGGYFLLKAIRLHLNPNPRLAIGLFLYSILYLFALFAAILLDRFSPYLMRAF